MASISKNSYGTYAVYWYDADKKKRQKNFKTKAEAKKFAATLELAPAERQSHILVKTLFEEYRDKVSSKKRGARNEMLRIDALIRRPFAQKTLATISTKDFIQHFEERSQEQCARTGVGVISPATLIKERTLLSSIFNYGISLKLISENPIHGVPKPQEPEHRERVATEEEIARLLVACGWDGKSVPETQSQLTVAAFIFSCKTGMRSGEILRIEESWIDDCVIHLPKEATKTDSRRDVALSREAVKILDLVKQMGERPKIFGLLSNARRDALWRKIRDRAGLGPILDSEGNTIKEGLNFHDARATFATWAASPNPKTGAPRLDVLALARQTGHKNLKMLQRYYRASASTIAKRLDE